MRIEELLYLITLRKDDPLVKDWQKELLNEIHFLNKALCVHWAPRGIGTGFNIPDLVTGVINATTNDMSGFVRTKEEGRLALAIFGNKAFLDYREFEPNWIQVKVSAKKEVLQELYDLVNANQNILTLEILNKAKSKDPDYKSPFDFGYERPNEKKQIVSEDAQTS